MNERKLHRKSQSLETSAPSFIWLCTGVKLQTHKLKHHPAFSLLFAQLRPCSPFWKAMMMHICYQHITDLCNFMTTWKKVKWAVLSVMVFADSDFFAHSHSRFFNHYCRVKLSIKVNKFRSIEWTFSCLSTSNQTKNLSHLLKQCQSERCWTITAIVCKSIKNVLVNFT